MENIECKNKLRLNYVYIQSVNSVNHDKIQKWYGYRGDTYLLTGTFPAIVIERTFLLLLLDRYLLP